MIDLLQHCSVSAPSICAQQFIRQYFQNGTLPEAGTVCDPIVKNPFLVTPSAQGTVVERAQQDGQDEDVELRQALLEAAERFQALSVPSLKRFGF